MLTKGVVGSPDVLSVVEMSNIIWAVNKTKSLSLVRVVITMPSDEK